MLVTVVGASFDYIDDFTMRVKIKKIDCLPTTNLLNLKSNTMKNTVQIYCFYMFYNMFSEKIILILCYFNIWAAVLKKRNKNAPVIQGHFYFFCVLFLLNIDAIQ